MSRSLVAAVDASAVETCTLQEDDRELVITRAGETDQEWSALVEIMSASFFTPVAPPRALVRKSTVIRRLHEAGKLAAVMGVLDMPANIYAKSRWWAPDWPEIYTDDPDAMALIAAVGGDVAAILAAE